MRQNLLALGFLLTTAWTFAQANTEIYLFDLELDDGSPILSNPKNISNNEGYDNQPSFLDDHTVLFSSTRDGQTDVLRFNITKGSTKQWLTNTQGGSEYSPMKIPGKEAISAIRLDLDGLQRLYEYSLDSGESKPISELKIGYHLWLDGQLLLATVLMGNRMDLTLIDTGENTHRIVGRNVGRSLHRIPGSQSVSYISKAKPLWEVMALDPTSGESEKLADCHKNREDINWLDENTMIVGSGKSLLTLELDSLGSWKTIMEFGQDQIHNISRIAINPARNRLAFVAEESPAIIVQKQLDAYNKGELEGFLDWYAQDALVQRYPDKILQRGKQQLFQAHQRFLDNTGKAKLEVVNRIVSENLVIDEEISTVDGRSGHQVSLTEVKNGRIASRTLIFPDLPTADTEPIVQELLQAFNERDIDTFMELIAGDVILYQSLNKAIASGKNALRQRYGGIIAGSPDLNVEGLNRIVIGNKVLQEGLMTRNGIKVQTVTLYEVVDGKISKITLIQ